MNKETQGMEPDEIADLRRSRRQSPSVLCVTNGRITTDSDVLGYIDSLLSLLAEAREQRDEAAKDAAAVRELMNVYNLGGWTDAIAPMKRALSAEHQLEQMRREKDEVMRAARAVCIANAGDLHTLPSYIAELDAAITRYEANLSSPSVEKEKK